MDRLEQYIKDGVHALLPLVEDKRDFSFTKVFGTTTIADIPMGDFYVSQPLEIKNQDINYPSDFCAAYAATEVSEDQSLATCVPEWSFAKSKQLAVQKLLFPTQAQIDATIAAFGCNLRDMCLVGTTYGFLSREYDPFACNTESRPERDFLANWHNWNADLDAFGYENAMNSFFAVDGPLDLFDNMRMVMWMNKNSHRSIVTGALWRASWSKMPGGIVTADQYDPSEPGSGHAFKIFGWKMTPKGLCLVAQLSDGPAFGDNGLFYFDRITVNREFAPFGAYTFSDVPKTQAQIHNEMGFPVNAPIVTKAWAIIIYALNQFLTANHLK